MSRRRRPEGELISLDSFLNICTIAVGALILVAVITVLGAGDVAVSSGPSTMVAPKSGATRVLFEAAGDKLYLVDEEGNGKRVLEAVREAPNMSPPSRDGLVDFLRGTDVGDENHRVTAEPLLQGMSWVYERREGAKGEGATELGRDGSPYGEALAAMSSDSFVYFVVHDDSFEIFRRARALAAARGVAVGWHPVEGNQAIRLAMNGSLGKRVQ
jgi:hypothetical protein